MKVSKEENFTMLAIEKKIFLKKKKDKKRQYAMSDIEICLKKKRQKTSICKRMI